MLPADASVSEKYAVSLFRVENFAVRMKRVR